ncbi:hypothetical protein THOA03_160081 [Vibrio owensii]|nr:hypothetical protein THOA03_160081 [Vibrio owensii]
MLDCAQLKKIVILACFKVLDSLRNCPKGKGAAEYKKKQSPTKGNNNEKNNLQFSSGCCVSVSKCFRSQ